MIYLKYEICNNDPVSNHKAANIARDFILYYAFGVKNAGNFIENERHGKPYIKGAPFNFSTAHTGSLAVAVACGKGEKKDGLVCIDEDVSRIGVDIECEDRHLEPESIQLVSEKMFSAKEREYINIGSKGEKTRFFEIWTRKESIVKATGEGLAGMRRAESLDTNIQYLKTHHINVNGRKYIISIAGI